MRALFARVAQEPVVLQQLGRCQTRVLVYVDELFQDVNALVGQVVTHQLVTTSLNPPVQLCIRLPLEREEAV